MTHGDGQLRIGEDGDERYCLFVYLLNIALILNTIYTKCFTSFFCTNDYFL